MSRGVTQVSRCLGLQLFGAEFGTDPRIRRRAVKPLGVKKVMSTTDAINTIRLEDLVTSVTSAFGATKHHEHGVLIICILSVVSPSINGDTSTYVPRLHYTTVD